MFRTKSLVLWITMIISIAGASIIYYYRFDQHVESIPWFVLCIPFALILLSYTLHQIWVIIYEKDFAVKVLNCYESKPKIFVTIISTCSTVVYIICVMAGLFLIEKLDEEDTGMTDYFICFFLIIILNV